MGKLEHQREKALYPMLLIEKNSKLLCVYGYMSVVR